MGITGSIIVYVLIWWIIFFFQFCQLESSQTKKFLWTKIGGIDPGAPKNPKIAKKFLITTIITTIIF